MTTNNRLVQFKAIKKQCFISIPQSLTRINCYYA